MFFFKQKTAYEMRISDWSSEVCSSDLCPALAGFASDRWFADRDAIKAVLRDHLATQATRYWLDRLEPAGIWAAPVNDWPAFTADPAFAALEATQQVRSPDEIGRAHV